MVFRFHIINRHAYRIKFSNDFLLVYTFNSGVGSEPSSPFQILSCSITMDTKASSDWKISPEKSACLRWRPSNNTELRLDNSNYSSPENQRRLLTNLFPSKFRSKNFYENSSLFIAYTLIQYTPLLTEIRNNLFEYC